MPIWPAHPKPRSRLVLCAPLDAVPEGKRAHTSNEAMGCCTSSAEHDAATPSKYGAVNEVRACQAEVSLRCSSHTTWRPLWVTVDGVAQLSHGHNVLFPDAGCGNTC